MADPAGMSLFHEDQLVSETKDKLILEEHGEPEPGCISPTPQHRKDRAALLEELVAVANRPPRRKMYRLKLSSGTIFSWSHSDILEAETIHFLVETFGRNGKYLFVNNYKEIYCAVSLCMFSEDEFKIVKGKQPEEVAVVELLETSDLDSRYALYHRDHLVDHEEWLQNNGLYWTYVPPRRFPPRMDYETWRSKANECMACGCYDLPAVYIPKSSYNGYLPTASFPP